MKPKLCVLAVSLALSTPSFAQDNLADVERITVTSDFRGQSLQKLPSSASIIAQGLIDVRQAQHLEEVLNLAPNINVASGASRGRFVQIRGIGERSQFSEPLNPSVGFYIDDFDFSGIAAVGTLFDVQQVEVLRGPQATEFGAGALAGVVKVKTTDAGTDEASRLELSLAQNNTWSLGAAHGGDLSDRLAYRVAVQQYKSDGYIDNIYLNREDTDNLDELTGRLKLRFQASDDLILDLNYQYFDIDNGYDAFSLDNDSKTRSDEPGFDRQQTHAFGFKATQALSWGQLLVIANHSDSDLEYGYDEDWTFVGFHPWEYSSTDHYFRDRSTTSADVRLLSNQQSDWFDGKTQWVIGAYTKQSQTDLLREYTFNDGDFTSDFEFSTQAAYLNTDTRLSDAMTLRVGLRVDRYELDYLDNTGFVENTDDTMFGGKVVLDYSVDRATVYASVSRGYKAGGFNPDQRVSEANRIFDPEYNWNYELGVKGRTEDNRGSVRLALFYMDREDTQINDFDVQIREDGTPDFVDIIVNADTGTNWGLELETSWELHDDVRLSANYGYLDATFEGAELANGTVVGKREQAQSPKHTANVAIDWFINDQLSWRIEADAKDDFRFSDGHDERASAYVLVNANLDYQLQDWNLSLWGKNLFDREYEVRGFGGFSNDPRDFYETPEPYYQFGDGRQVGVTARYQF